MEKKKVNSLNVPIIEFIDMLDDAERLAILRAIVDDFGGINILMKYRDGSVDNGVYIEGKGIKFGPYANAALEVNLKYNDFDNGKR